MKKIIAIILGLITALCTAFSVSAASVDDGVIEVAEKDGNKFFGTRISQDITKYLAADGSDKAFYDLTDDRTMDICDLVKLENNSVDITDDKNFDNNDRSFLRTLILYSM